MLMHFAFRWFQVIGECHASRVDNEIAAKYKLMNDSHDRDLFLEFCLHTILYQPPAQGFGTLSNNGILQSSIFHFHF